jgi:ubiquinone/menaquinone biosynthesis C-methylase UbiE
MLQAIRTKAQAARLPNIVVVQGTETDSRLPDNAIDLALLVDVYHEFQHPQEMLRSIQRSLKAQGELVVVEYRKEDPAIPIADTHRMSVANLRTEIEAEGFHFDRLATGLPRQHVVVFRKANPN